MAKLEYIPGFWNWVKNLSEGGYHGIVGKDGVDVLYPDCCIDGDNGLAWFDDFPSEADGKLIVSAPDMYEALLEIHRHWKDINFIHDNYENLVNTLKDIGYIIDEIIEKVEKENNHESTKIYHKKDE